MTLGLIGSSNSGKSFLVDLFTSNFETYEIGNIIPPAKDTLSEFWLMNCVYASVKRMEEFYIPTLAFKSLSAFLRVDTSCITQLTDFARTITL